MTYAEILAEGRKVLAGAGIVSPEVDAFYLFEAAAGTCRAEYLLKKDQQAPDDIKEKFRRFIEQREAHVPYQYILGEADFCGYKFKVDENVLIPRLDTEVLAWETIKLIPEGSVGSKVLDMCTGSGCIGITIKKERPAVKLCLSDISENALKLAQENAANNLADMAEDIEFILSDLFESIAPVFDIIVSNPPYVTEREFAALDPEVRDHEPELALLAGVDGLDVYKRLIPGAAEHLNEGGFLMLEIGCSQAAAVEGLMRRAGFSDIYIKKDLVGLDRVVCGRK